MANETDRMAPLKSVLKTKKLILGSRRSLIEMKNGNVGTLYLTANAPEALRDDVAHMAQFVETDVVELEVLSDEFGIVCKRQHPVSVAAVLK